MLRNVLGAYLDGINERQLDLPLMALLAAMGFTDIHYTHGHVEFGKDVIAKRVEDGATIQYSFQSKAGNISYAEWRNGIQGQILESVLIPLSHPNFATELPHQAVLLTTGDLRGNAGPEFQSLNEKIKDVYKHRPIVFWGRENLIDLFEQYSVTSIHPLTEAGLVSYTQFFLVYGRALSGELSEREIEDYSRRWLDPALPRDQRLFQAAIESAAIAAQCAAHGLFYEAIIAHLGLLRAVLEAVYNNGDDPYLRELYARGLEELHQHSLTYIDEVERQWSANRDFIFTSTAMLVMTTYLVQCARVMEVAALAYFSTEEESVRLRLGAFVEAFIQQEPGCHRPLSDRYTISVILATLVLCDQQRAATARELVEHVAIWLLDRVEKGAGLAAFEANEQEETQVLLGYMFDFIDLPQTGGSILASALCALAAFLGDRQLYADIVNDIAAYHIFPEYWQPSDTEGVCRIDGEDVRGFPNVRHTEELTSFSDYTFADYLPSEISTFRVVDVFGLAALPVLMALLRDRYFPKLWPRLAPGWAGGAGEANGVGEAAPPAPAEPAGDESRG